MQSYINNICASEIAVKTYELCSLWSYQNGCSLVLFVVYVGRSSRSPTRTKIKQQLLMSRKKQEWRLKLKN